ncbi:phosphotransferase family protein, partial [Actinomadura adrarensis]
MPVPDQRDPEVTLAKLTGWLDGHLPGARIPVLDTPATSGFSNETLMFEAEWNDPDDGRPRHGTFVARVAPNRYQLFPEPRFEEQYRLLRILDRETGIPVPPIHWYEPSPEILGAPFFVMERVDGRVPTDMPPYHTDGWVTEIAPDERAAMWWSALEILARVHRLDV